MKISLISAMANNRVIVIDNQMPWHLPADFAWFKKHTIGKPIIMGRKTYESIGRPLPKRLNIVVSRDPNLSIDGVMIANSLEQAFEFAKTHEESQHEEVMVIGGDSIYQAVLPQADKLYLTFVDADIQGDAYFPEFDSQEWQEAYSENYLADENNSFDMRFVIYQRV